SRSAGGSRARDRGGAIVVGRVVRDGASREAVKVVLSPTARRQLTALSGWWDAYRADARVRVEDALELAVAAIAEHPAAGPNYSGDPRYRTWRLKGTPYLLFYRIDEAGGGDHHRRRLERQAGNGSQASLNHIKR